MESMTPKISNEEIELCRQVPIHKLVGNNRLNRKVKIVCPFHAEKTGSCNLFPTGGFHCFGCGANGNTIDFVARLSDKTDEREAFKEAVEELRRYI